MPGLRIDQRTIGNTERFFGDRRLDALFRDTSGDDASGQRRGVDRAYQDATLLGDDTFDVERLPTMAVYSPLKAVAERWC